MSESLCTIGFIQGEIKMESKYREVINPKTLFQAEGFSHAVGTTGTKVFYLSGQLPWDENFQVVGEGILKNRQKSHLKTLSMS